MNEYFKSSDMALVTALNCLGYSIEAIDRTNRSRALFCIPRDEYLDENVQSFWAHQLQIDPLLYFNCLKEMKTRLYNNDE